MIDSPTTRRETTSALEHYFQQFREGIIGNNQTFETPFGKQQIVYADWIASGRLYGPIEQKIQETFGPFVGNTHSESSITGTCMTRAYHDAHRIIKAHVNAGPDDVIITAETGMTGVICKFQRILGLKLPSNLKAEINIPPAKRPVVFITHMEHHSNQTSWLETIADVIQLPADDEGFVNLESMHNMLLEYKDRPLKIGSFTSCSNVTGVQTPYHAMSKIMHQHGGYCFVDFAASAPYVDIDMHPEDPMEKLDAVFFSPHKFLGGPGTSGCLIFDSSLYQNSVPDNPGGGTVMWTNPWGEHNYFPDIEAREDGGTPGFLQAIRTALAIKLKEDMGVANMAAREKELLAIAFDQLRQIPRLHILADHIEDRLGVISFYVEDIHYNLLVKLLNDRYGIQVRGGCSCAGTYGHFLLHVDRALSKSITDQIDSGDLSAKPGWVRLSIHPTLEEKTLHYILEALAAIVDNIDAWQKDYAYCNLSNEFTHVDGDCLEKINLESWFEFK
ncbi:MAG: aminotransferase class V-fold PLP-dependent enzyme [Bacteroidota bacterium]